MARRDAPPEIYAAELADALVRGNVEVLFQPQFSTAGNVLIGAEALASWHLPGTGRVAGDQLFAIAERTGLASALSRLVGRSALVVAAQWPGHLRLSLNITAAGLASGVLPERLGELLDQSGFPAERLTLEITEQALIADLAEAAAVLQVLVDRGMRIELDDFGAGYCNFAYLKRLPLHGIKLDRSMAHGIEAEGRDLAVLRGIMAMAQALGLEVTAEGIERQEQLDAVIREGCAKWQGFLGAPPLNLADFAVLAKRLPVPASPLS